MIPLVSKWSDNSGPLTPVPADFVLEQVFILHNYNLICYFKRQECNCSLCTVHTICSAHLYVDFDSCSGYVERDVQNEFLVFNSRLAHCSNRRNLIFLLLLLFGVTDEFPAFNTLLATTTTRYFKQLDGRVINLGSLRAIFMERTSTNLMAPC